MPDVYKQAALQPLVANGHISLPSTVVGVMYNSFVGLSFFFVLALLLPLLSNFFIAIYLLIIDLQK
jgi:hypothetical protein